MEQRLDVTYLRPGPFAWAAAAGITATGIGMGVLLTTWGISLLWRYTPPEIAVHIANPEVSISQTTPLIVTQDKPFVVAQPEPLSFSSPNVSMPMRRTRPSCCARAVSGQAAAPPSPAMKSRRRRLICPSRAGGVLPREDLWSLSLDPAPGPGACPGPRPGRQGRGLSRFVPWSPRSGKPSFPSFSAPQRPGCGNPEEGALATVTRC